MVPIVEMVGGRGLLTLGFLIDEAGETSHRVQSTGTIELDHISMPCLAASPAFQRYLRYQRKGK